MKSVKFYRVVESGKKYKQSAIVSAESEEDAIEKASAAHNYHKKDCASSLYAEYTAHDIIDSVSGQSDMGNYISDTEKHRITWEYQKWVASNATEPSTKGNADCIYAEIYDQGFILDL